MIRFPDPGSTDADVSPTCRAQDAAGREQSFDTILFQGDECPLDHRNHDLYAQIIDRIIAQPGFEQVLSVDYKTHRFGSRSASASQRGPLKEVVSAMQESQAGAPHSEQIISPKELNPSPSLSRPRGEGEDTPGKNSGSFAMQNLASQETKSQKRVSRFSRTTCVQLNADTERILP